MGLLALSTSSFGMIYAFQPQGFLCPLENKQPMLLMHVVLILLLGEPPSIVPCKNGTVKEAIPNSLVLVKYTINIQRVDVIDQLRVFYSS